MGHYDSSYEHDYQLQREENTISANKNIKKVFEKIIKISKDSKILIENHNKYDQKEDLDILLKSNIFDIQKQLSELYKEIL